MKHFIAYLLTAAILTSCAQPNQNRYGFQDVGHASEVEFGTLISSRPVEITGKNTGTGAVAGAGAGAVAGSALGNGRGSLIALIGGAVIGGIAGHMTEQAISDHDGMEYVVTLRNGKSLTIVQNIGKDDRPLHKGQRVMVQTSGAYQRVLPADDLPEKAKKAKQIEVVD